MQAGGWCIGPGRQEDLQEILALAREAFITPWTESQFLQEFALPLSTILVARPGEGRGGSLLGYLVFWLVCDEMHLQDIAVRSGDRRQGIASRLLAAAVRQARLQGASRATLEVRESNLAAQHLYETFGFTCSGRRPGYYGDRNEDALIYWADLTNSAVDPLRSRARSEEKG